jgi:serine/threonine-protein kinase
VLSEGQVLENKYRVDRLLARGGMGAIFVGQHIHIKRKVAIKILHAGEQGRGDALRRFEKEAQAAGQIGSDHIVEVLDVGVTPEGDRFMVMEFLDGESLKQRIRAREKLEPIEIVPLAVQLLQGLAAAHAANIVHRDLKPDNVFLLREKAGRRDFVKIVDFGISKFGSLTGEAGEMTQAGAVMGTPFYMSPEHARSASTADARSDLYSVGVILYQALTGALPFKATTFAELLFKIVFEAPPHPQTVAPHLDDALAAVVVKAMAREPADRYQTAAALQLALEQWMANATGLSRTNVHANIFQASSPTDPLPRFEDPTLFDSSPSSARAASLLPRIAQDSLPPLSQRSSSLSQDLPLITPPSLPSLSAAAAPPWSAQGPDLSQSGSVSGHHRAGGGPTLDTQKSWNSSTFAPRRRSGLIAAAILGALGVVGVALASWLTSEVPPAEPLAAASSAPLTSAPSAGQATAPSSSASPAASAEPAVAPSASVSEAPPEASATSKPSARRPTTQPAQPRPPATPQPKSPTAPAPAPTISDFGY